MVVSTVKSSRINIIYKKLKGIIILLDISLYKVTSLERIYNAIIFIFGFSKPVLMATDKIFLCVIVCQILHI